MVHGVRSWRDKSFFSDISRKHRHFSPYLGPHVVEDWTRVTDNKESARPVGIDSLILWGSFIAIYQILLVSLILSRSHSERSSRTLAKLLLQSEKQDGERVWLPSCFYVSLNEYRERDRHMDLTGAIIWFEFNLESQVMARQHWIWVQTTYMSYSARQDDQKDMNKFNNWSKVFW